MCDLIWMFLTVDTPNTNLSSSITERDLVVINVGNQLSNMALADLQRHFKVLYL